MVQAQRGENISIHAPRVGSDHQRRFLIGVGAISIHAPRVGSDVLCVFHLHAIPPISIHAPRVGSDPLRLITPMVSSRYFNPRSPCGERRA